MHRVPHIPQGLGNAMHGHTRLAHNPDCSLHTRSSSTLATCTVSFQASAPCAGHAHLSSTQSLPSSTLTQSKGSHQCWRAQHITGSSQADLPISTHSCVTGSSCPPGLELGAGRKYKSQHTQPKAIPINTLQDGCKMVHTNPSDTQRLHNTPTEGMLN